MKWVRAIRNSILVIGAAHIDRKAMALTQVQLKTSIPVHMTQSYGGVAHNVAENLARLGQRVSLLSIVGHDGEGERLREHFHALNINDRMLITSSQNKTATYTALLDETGEMFIALADMAIYEELTPAFFQGLGHTLSEHSYWFVDTNIPEDSLKYLCKLKQNYRHVQLFVDPVSVPKAKRLKKTLNGIDFIFPNRDELEILAEQSIATHEDIVAASKSLLALGVGNVIATMGPEGVYVVNAKGAKHYAAYQVEVVDVTGAGDALVAGFMYGYHQTHDIDNAIQYGLACATLSLSTVHTVSPNMSISLLDEIIKRKGM